MYKQSHFIQDDEQKMLDLIKSHSLATLVTLTSTGLVGNHIPMIVEQRNKQLYLQGHVAKNNDIWQDIDEAVDVLAIFNGPDAYITPSWYPSKKIDGKVVPTWNYAVVHVSGKLKHYQDKKRLLAHLHKLSQFNESSKPQPWKLTDAPQQYIDKMLNAIVGIEIEISHMQGKTKMSQNHPATNQQGVIEGLRSEGQNLTASWVEKPGN
jgi:transcriptional regulator